MSAALGTPASNVSVIGQSIFTTYLLAFEVTSALLAVAVVGAVVLVRRPRRQPEDDVSATGGTAGPDEVAEGPDDPRARTPPETELTTTRSPSRR